MPITAMPHCPVIGVRLVQDGTGPLRVPRRVNQPAIAAAAFADLLADCDRETVATLLLATNHRPLGLHIVTVGTLDSAPVHPREVFNAAILANAANLIIAHNHPSGDPTPSRADHEMLRRLAGAGALLGIRVVDYIIVGVGGAYWSAQEADGMPPMSGRPGRSGPRSAGGILERNLSLKSGRGRHKVGNNGSSVSRPSRSAAAARLAGAW
jgi:DNA repair protein RadC